jgi:hypothetical protein
MDSGIKADHSYHVEDVEHSPSPNKHDELSLDEIAPDEEKRIMRKIDRRLVPLLGACYVSEDAWIAPIIADHLKVYQLARQNKSFRGSYRRWVFRPASHLVASC